MMEKNSQAYQLLTLICMSGECSEKAVSIFIPEQDQRNRLLAKLIVNKLVKKYQKDNMTGLRLTRKSKDFCIHLNQIDSAFIYQMVQIIPCDVLPSQLEIVSMEFLKPLQ